MLNEILTLIAHIGMIAGFLWIIYELKIIWEGGKK